MNLLTDLEISFLENKKINSIEKWLSSDWIDFILKQNDAFIVDGLEIISEDQLWLKSHEIIPKILDLMSNANPILKKKATRFMGRFLDQQKNMDLNPILPIIFTAYQSQEKNKLAIDALASCVFVQEIHSDTLSIILPILKRGFRHKNLNETIRKCCVIIDNIFKLAEDDYYLKQIISETVPSLEVVAQECSKPEVRKMGVKALETLKQIKCKEPIVSIDEIKKWIADEKQIMCVKNLLFFQCRDFQEWKSILVEKENHEVRQIMDTLLPNQGEQFGWDTGEDTIYKGTFTLAYGTLTLLKNTYLHLVKHRFYSLLGENNCGKTTLMRAIANEQIEGFPKKEECRTLFVEHEIPEIVIGKNEDGSDRWTTDLSGLEWVYEYCKTVSKEVIRKKMSELGFGTSKQERAADMDKMVSSYSGGWKMKLQLCAASLVGADILMLDEPTGHLDVKNIEWLKNWLREFIQQGGSILCSSHDSNFLSEMSHYFIDFQNKRLFFFHGSLEEFVQHYPEKKSYFTLETKIQSIFKFPIPGSLEGVKSRSKCLLKMDRVSFTYPSRNQPTVTDISLECSRISRVALIGPNGAGKSTAIQLLIGKLKPTSGTVIRHPNVRIAYVSQHALTHVEQYLQHTPVQYIMKRFSGNEDKESMEHSQENDVKEYKKYYLDQGVLKECYTENEIKKAVELNKLISRRDTKKEKEYLAEWKGQIESTWVNKHDLFSMGYAQHVYKIDEKIALESGLMNRTLTTSSIVKHLSDFGLEEEQAAHVPIGSLSGGQKVKVVLGASFWLNPHIVVLDEPTNYLDRESLGSLIQALKEFEGGIIIISHNREFAESIAQEKWIMDNGYLRREGESICKTTESEKSMETPDVILDSMGNEIKIQKEIVLSEREKKIKKKNIQKKIQEAKKKKTLSEEEILDLELELENL